jgi:hypothetical protein
VSGAEGEHRWRVSLRPANAEDAAAVDPWLNEAIAAVQGRSVEVPATSLTELSISLSVRERLHLIAGTPPSEDENVPIGLMVTVREAGKPVVIRALAIRDSKRNLGYGSEAVYELEAGFPKVGLAANVPVTNGLAVYFWLRAGFRPAFPGGFHRALADNRFFPPVAKVWMRRDAIRTSG